MKDSPERAALHEAAHAVVALEFDVQIERMVIRQRGSRFYGAVKHAPIEDPDIDSTISVAGQVAEKLAGLRRRHYRGDYDADYAGLPSDAEVAELKASAILRSRWRQVNGLAAALLRAGGTLTSSEINTVLRERPSDERGPSHARSSRA